MCGHANKAVQLVMRRNMYGQICEPFYHFWNLLVAAKTEIMRKYLIHRPASVGEKSRNGKTKAFLCSLATYQLTTSNLPMLNVIRVWPRWVILQQEKKDLVGQHSNHIQPTATKRAITNWGLAHQLTLLSINVCGERTSRIVQVLSKQKTKTGNSNLQISGIEM